MQLKKSRKDCGRRKRGRKEDYVALEPELPFLARGQGITGELPRPRSRRHAGVERPTATDAGPNGRSLPLSRDKRTETCGALYAAPAEAAARSAHRRFGEEQPYATAWTGLQRGGGAA